MEILQQQIVEVGSPALQGGEEVTLCSEKDREQIELLQLDRGEIRVAEYLVELPPREMLEAKLHEAMGLARGQVAAREQ